MSKKILSVSGAYWTGSSAFFDLLSECKCCKIIPTEYKLFGFGELFYQLENYSHVENNYSRDNFARCLNAAHEFRKLELYPIRGILRRILTKIDFYPYFLFSNRSIINLLFGRNYRRATKIFIDHLRNTDIQCLAFNHKEIESLVHCIFETIPANDEQSIFVFDQMIAPVYYAESSKYISGMKCINVDRDWRDQFISMRSVYSQMLKTNEAIGIHPWNENYNLIKHLSAVEYFINLRKGIHDIKKLQANNANVMWFNFEDLIYNKRKTVEKLLNFCQIPMSQWSENTIFFEKKSALRTKKWESLDPKSIIREEISYLETQIDETPYLKGIEC